MNGTWQEFIAAFVQGAAHSILAVWPWLVAMGAVELVSPARRLHWRTWGFNAMYLPVYLTFASMALYPVIQLIEPRLPTNITGLNMKDIGVWGRAIIVVAYLVAFDFFYYWFHRAQHAWSWMWRLHRFHHADANVAVFSATRHHWLEEAIRYFSMTAPLLILVGHPEEFFPWIGVVIGVDGLFIHWNSRLRLGRLTGIIVGPQYHRIHHSLEAQHFDKNFAVMFPFWDRLFGTQSLPRGNEFPETGVSEVLRPNGWRLLLPWPLKHA